MSIFGAIVTYLVIWWLVLFTVLPWGIHSQQEANDIKIARGSDPSAPQHARIGRKFLITTLISGLIWGFFALIFNMNIISIYDFV